MTRAYFAYGPGEMHLNDEGYSYVHRVMEFGDLLRAGYLSPQWAVDFRLGLGSPYFGYYQPLFCYLASAFAAVLPLPTAIAATLWRLAFAGYAGMLALVRRRFGAAAGTLAGTALFATPYVRTEPVSRGRLGAPILPLTTLAAIVAIRRSRELDLAQRRLIASMASIAAGVVFLSPRSPRTQRRE